MNESCAFTARLRNPPAQGSSRRRCDLGCAAIHHRVNCRWRRCVRTALLRVILSHSPPRCTFTKSARAREEPVRLFIALSLFSFGVGALQAQTPTISSQSEDCGHFVQQFYNWYLATEIALVKRNGLGSFLSALELTLREKRSSFSRVGEGLRRRSRSVQKIAGGDRGVGFRSLSPCPGY